MNMCMIDTHCHLEQDDFVVDLNEVIQRAQEGGICCISSGIAPSDWERTLSISKAASNVYASIGLDPMQSEFTGEMINFIRTHRSEIIAVGEVGLDYYRERDHSQRNLQERNFVSAIHFAIETGLPLQIHSRSAGKRCLEILEKNGASSVHMHAFDGRASFARVASRELDYYFSIPTSVVRSPQKQKLVKALDIERILVETDSPVLSAVRGTRNEPSNLPIAIKEIARILRRDEEEMQQIILENTLNLYRNIASSR